MWKIKKNVIDAAFEASNNYLPDEFMCFLGGDKKSQIINEIVLLPTYNGKTFSSINLGTIPIDETIVGSLHSHPNGCSKFSDADKNFFKRFEINIILGVGKNNEITFYDNKSNKINVIFVD